MDINKLCPHCMREGKEEGERFCSCCGKPLNAMEEIQHQLKPVTILAGKYVVGAVLGEGGFGITYIGFDLNLEIRVAIKEFYPNGYATREAQVTNELTAYAGQSMEAVYKWRDNFIKEARSLAKCSHLSGVVGVKDFFQENNTAYIVQEYLEGVTLKDYMKEQGGRVPANWLINAIEPVMTSLGQVHKEGLVHRDISPDNIMLLKNGQMKLLDFGAARDYTESGERSLSILLKPGYAPEEQYRSKGKQGPWSDVYALAGTIYKCITGLTPPESMERMRQDEMQAPSKLGIEILPKQEQALLKAMAVFAENRYQSMEHFHQAMYQMRDTAQVSSVAPVSVNAVKKPESSTVGKGVTGAPVSAAAGAKPTAETSAVQNNQGAVNDTKEDARKFLITGGAVLTLVLAAVFFAKGLDSGKGSGAAETTAAQAVVYEAKDVVQNTEIIETVSYTYILANSDSAYYREADLDGLTKEELRLARNEIYARHGCTFDSEDLNLYFNSQPWYHGYITVKEFDDRIFNRYEKANLDVIKMIEAGASIHSYDLIVADSTWEEAYRNCINRGGYLVHINSLEEYNAIVAQIYQENKKGIKFWIGGSRDYDTSEYHWVNPDGTYHPEALNNNSAYNSFWLENEPSFVGDGMEEVYMNMIYMKNLDKYVWNDTPNDLIAIVPGYSGSIGYICEYEE